MKSDSKDAEKTPAPQRRAFEAWVDYKKVPAWLAAATKTKFSLPEGRPMNEADFDKKIEETRNEPLNGY